MKLDKQVLFCRARGQSWVVGGAWWLGIARGICDTFAGAARGMVSSRGWSKQCQRQPEMQLQWVWMYIVYHSLMYSANAFSTNFLATSVNIISPDSNRLHFGWLLSPRIFWVFWFSACFCWSMLIKCVVGCYSRCFLLLIGKRFDRRDPEVAPSEKDTANWRQSLATKSSFPAAALGLLRYRPKWALQLQMETSCHQNSQKKTEWSWAYLGEQTGRWGCNRKVWLLPYSVLRKQATCFTLATRNPSAGYEITKSHRSPSPSTGWFIKASHSVQIDDYR